MYVHYKKVSYFSIPPGGMSLTNSPWQGIIRGRKIANLFFQCMFVSFLLVNSYDHFLTSFIQGQYACLLFHSRDTCPLIDIKGNRFKIVSPGAQIR
jgi:hypothetical protein